MAEEKKLDRTQCAGQQCVDRDKCIRFVNRGKHPWASFDIERMRAPTEPCPHRVYCRGVA